MELIYLSGYFGTLLIGKVLGLIGDRGSILTVPVLVYLLAVNPVTTTAHCLFIVGTSSWWCRSKHEKEVDRFPNCHSLCRSGFH